MSIIDRIICLVKENKLSGTQFGAILNLKKSPLTDWKNNKSKPTLDQIISICEYFAVSADYLLFGNVDSGFPTTPPDDSSLRLNDQKNTIYQEKLDQNFIEVWHNLSHSDQIIILGEMYKLKKDDVFTYSSEYKKAK